MCGIFLKITPLQSENQDDNKENIDLVNFRGPDGFKTIDIELNHVKLKMCCSVLNLRGNRDIVLQPIENDYGDVLFWNGEVWDGLEMAFFDNDTVQLMKALSSPFTNIFDVMSHIYGPYSFKNKEKLWYGRDCLGRRSLLKQASLETNSSFHFLLSSVSNGDILWEEVPANGLYCLDLSRVSENKFEEERIPYVHESSDLKGLYLKYPYPLMNMSLEPVGYERLNMYVDEFYNILKHALYIRTMSIPLKSENQPRLAILYSGGLDSSVLAKIIHEILPLNEPVDLLNVAFEDLRFSSEQKEKSSKNTSFDDVYNCPDRITGFNAYKELCEVTENQRPWRFVQINISRSELNSHKSTIIKLMHPNDTVMDFNISMAFYFAARGYGVLRYGDDSLVEYNSVARLIFFSLGADEQLGGYSQHLKKYISGGWSEVINELSYNISRLSYRNLGRDDRVISHHGKEIRYPYLDENVVKFLCKLPVRGKMDFTIQNGEKLLLRKLCQKLGLIYPSKEKKRAIQFGSRSAKIGINIGKKVNGYDKLEKKCQ
ncbi:hypothetical protein PORY_002158 [Pneumocystis oryctolagi]|uniref:Uncharacterized protein n=1 Tax=Pneumocystis oryctolagi TaxID=42067 RepID=A0ACB7CBZ4_9ASCO|nr:hypothetical protein PORY_002158 [Pneumocystis oryctolagi]